MSTRIQINIIVPRQLISQCDLAHPQATRTKYAPGNVFDTSAIPTKGVKIVEDKPMKIARDLIERGLRTTPFPEHNQQ